MKHVFISYVKENKKKVNKLYQDLTSQGIQVWLDRNDIDPGVRWKQAIRRAIQQGAFFIACFSTEYNIRSATYMNEELTVAIEELRRRSSDKAWFIPLKLNECEIPDRDIGGGETLQDLHYTALYENWDTGIQRILRVIQSNSSESIPQEGQSVSSSAATYFISGQTKYAMGQYNEAIAEYNKAISIKQDFAQAFANRGLAREKLEQHGAASTDFNRAIQLNPYLASVYVDQGNSKYKLGLYEDAITNFDIASRLSPNHTDAYYKRGLARIELGLYEDAITDFNQTNRCLNAADEPIRGHGLNPKLADSYYNRGNARFNLNQYENAITDYSHALHRKQDFAEAYYMRGLARFNLAQYDYACLDFDNVIRLEPGWKGHAYYRRGLTKEAMTGHKWEAEPDLHMALRFAEQFDDQNLKAMIEEFFQRLN